MHIATKILNRTSLVLALVLSALVITEALVTTRSTGRPTPDQIRTMPLGQLLDQFYNNREVKAYFDANTKKQCILLKILVTVTQMAIRKQQAKLAQLQQTTRALDASGSPTDLAASYSQGSSPEDIVRDALIKLEAKLGATVGGVTIDQNMIITTGATLIGSLPGAVAASATQQQRDAQDLVSRLQTSLANKQTGQAPKAADQEAAKALTGLAQMLPSDATMQEVLQNTTKTDSDLTKIGEQVDDLQQQLSASSDPDEQASIQAKLDALQQQHAQALTSTLTSVATNLTPAVIVPIPSEQTTTPTTTTASSQAPAVSFEQAKQDAQTALNAVITFLSPTDPTSLKLRAASASLTSLSMAPPSASSTGRALSTLRIQRVQRGLARRTRTLRGSKRPPSPRTATAAA